MDRAMRDCTRQYFYITFERPVVNKILPSSSRDTHSPQSVEREESNETGGCVEVALKGKGTQSRHAFRSQLMQISLL